MEDKDESLEQLKKDYAESIKKIRQALVFGLPVDLEQQAKDYDEHKKEVNQRRQREKEAESREIYYPLEIERKIFPEVKITKEEIVRNQQIKTEDFHSMTYPKNKPKLIDQYLKNQRMENSSKEENDMEDNLKSSIPLRSTVVKGTTSKYQNIRAMENKNSKSCPAKHKYQIEKGESLKSNEKNTKSEKEESEEEIEDSKENRDITYIEIEDSESQSINTVDKFLTESYLNSSLCPICKFPFGLIPQTVKRAHIISCYDNEYGNNEFQVLQEEVYTSSFHLEDIEDINEEDED
ncbi:MAG: hypothetical protein MJ252_17860 [archaeon]|nr:hypothetical protein [archaeon]